MLGWLWGRNRVAVTQIGLKLCENDATRLGIFLKQIVYLPKPETYGRKITSTPEFPLLTADAKGGGGGTPQASPIDHLSKDPRRKV